ncbi:MAG: MFS transporter [Nostoc sp. DedQUE05]|uniref:MFS transporter n=1 Tax=Nostoc sp. DedQUE05 TaxID=3075391 RepID=UPI002AD5844D|nr:MFS transporter [Nostoc sp. DedQUE05]MDZ8091512.1 MFS transporter [Nostoc sp. DedQUE05]
MDEKNVTEQLSLPLYCNRDYRLWFIGNLISSMGTQMTLIAMPLLVLLMTQSPLKSSLVASFETLPYALFSLPVGVLVDRISRRDLMVSSSILSLLAVGSIPLAYSVGNLTISHLIVVGFIKGVASLFYQVSQMSALPALVSNRQLGAASAQSEMIERLAAIVGPPTAALLFHNIWPGLPFVVDALSFGIIVLCILSLRSCLGPKPPFPPMNLRKDLLVGAGIVAGQPLVKDLTILNTAGDCLFAGIGLLMIVLVRDAGFTGAEVGFVFSTAAVGGVIGAVVSNRLEQRIGLAQAVIGKHVLTVAIFPLLVLDFSPLAFGLLWALISFQVSILNVIQRKYMLHITPQDSLGRVQSFMTFLSFGSLPVGIAITGYLLETTGKTETVLFYTTVLALLALFSILSRSIRHANNV